MSAVNPTDWKERSRRGPGDFEFEVPNQDAADRIRAAAPGGVDRIVEVDLGHDFELDARSSLAISY